MPARSTATTCAAGSSRPRRRDAGAASRRSPRSATSSRPLVDAVARLLAGGKRLRAGFLYWGYRAAGRPDSDALVRLAAAMEFFQAAALLHDDVMDGSDTRRGMPAAHRALAALHARPRLGR